MAATILERNRRYWSYFKGVFQNEMGEESPRFTDQPTGIKAKLYPHQRTILQAAINLEKTKQEGIECGGQKKLYANYGVIADRVGSGKSLVALSLVKQPPPDEREIVTNFRNNNLSMIKYQIPEPTKTRIKTALFIVPHSIMGQWETYITEQTTINVIFCRRKKEVCDKTLYTFFPAADAVFVSSTMYKEFESNQNLDKFHWSRIFIDEADTIQAVIRATLTANFIWLITASYLNIAFPSGITHNLSHPYYHLPADEQDPILNSKIMKHHGTVLNVSGISTNAPFLKTLIGHTDIFKNADLQSWRVVLRNSDEYIDFSFTMPPIVHLQILCRSPANLRILESLIPNEIMDMLHAGDTRGALQALGVHDETPTSIIDSLTTTLRKELEQQRRKYEFSKTIEYSSESAKQKSLESQEVKIQSLVSRIETIEKRMSEIETANCPICYSDIETPTLTPCCKNVFCFACLCESLKRQPVCPLCRGAITSVSELHVVNKAGNTIVQQTDGPKTKTEEFLLFVEANPSAKILLFSEFDASFLQLQNEMSRRDIKYSAINGSTARISNILSSFEAGEFRVLFLNSRHVGAGLNIISATDVFLFHKMTSEMEKQIIGRAYRIGRKKPLRVHHLLYQSEIKPS